MQINQVKLAVIFPEKFWQRPEIVLLEDIELNSFKVPAGYKCDGASTPFTFRFFLNPLGQFLVPAIIHDYLTDQKYEKKMRDQVFRDAAKSQGIAFSRIFLAYFLVRFYSIFILPLMPVR